MNPREPTSDECNVNAEQEVATEFGPRRAFAAWYPSMGGYVGHCVIVPPISDNDCFEVYVWHNGDFPFGEDNLGVPENPRNLHHCDPAQFIGFGRLCEELEERVGVTDGEH